MSRDAKVGLVIIGTFAFLLGTILTYRFHRTGGPVDGSLNEPVVSESDDESPSKEVGTSFPVGDSTVPPVTVDARLPDPQPAHSQGHTGSGFAEAQRLLRTPNLNRPPTDLSEAHANGAMISLTEGETYQQPAAIVESTDSTARQRRFDGDLRGNAAERANRLHGHPQPPLGNNNSAHDVALDDASATQVTSEDSEDSQQNAGADARVASSDAMEADTETDKIDNKDGDTSAIERQVADQYGPASRAPRDATGLEEAEGVRQAAGKRGMGRDEDRPPSLPRFGESRQATIESMLPRTTPADSYTEMPPQTPDNRSLSPNRKTPRKSDAIDDSSSAVQRTYVVKDGDSFWSISAKQYGTGKYFRALEEFNSHRLAAYEDGRKILRPGTEILLPDPSVLRSKSATSKAASISSTSDEREGGKAREETENAPPRNAADSWATRASSASDRRTGESRLYRVQQGDTLSIIAQRELGSSKRWREIYELNRANLDNEEVIRIGMELKLPAEQVAEKLVDRPYGGR